MQSKIVSRAGPRGSCCKGFTLVELLVVAVLVALFAVMAMPSFIAWRMRDQVDARARVLVSSLTYARSEAIRRGVRVTLCRIDAARRCLAARTPCDDGALDWSCGWAVMADARVAPSILRMQSRMAAVAIQGSAAEIAFTPPAGQVIGGFRSLEVAPREVGASTRGDGWRRCIRIAAGGRARLTEGRCGSAA
ncbi:prepilin-type N-terminal cleavage/methylation domain-containing protein [Trinickia violacea]|uniref:Type II secretion system protein H n=1 Tax=Trinickia violacea TaxID=2571746 RepID=A0A4P8IUY1_9BURK|nr:GspH/FimT family protein [Trinickia violacea]QCP50914.1 prepilin-type N-terminal cleavage/methylation domain-containing protein [Trinickia violacea]